MKKIVFMLVLIFSFGIFSVYAEDEINVSEEFSDSSDISNWKYTKRMWQTVPWIENDCLNMIFTGTKTASNHLITHTFDSTYNVANDNNIVLEMKVKFNDNVCLADSFPSIVGGAYDGKIENDDGKYVYKISAANNEKVTVGTIEPNKEYIITAKINFVTKSRNVYIENVSTGDIQKAEDIKYSANVSSVQQIKILGYVENEDKPATVKIDYIKLYRDSFEIISSNIVNGEEDVSADSEISFSVSKAILEDTIGTGMETSEDSNTGIKVESDEFIPYHVSLKEDKRTVLIDFPTGLRYGSEYKVTIPATIKSISGDSIAESVYVFTTEKKPKRCENISVYDMAGAKLKIDSITNKNKIKLVSTLVNNSGNTEDIELLVAMYNSTGKFLGIRTAPITVIDGKNDYTTEIDLSGLENVKLTLKVFYINKLKGVQIVY